VISSDRRSLLHPGRAAESRQSPGLLRRLYAERRVRSLTGEK